MTALQLATLVAASAGAGFMNALAGGGTLLTFPALVLLGVPAIRANATSTVALLPGAVASIFGYRRDVATHRDWLKTLIVPSLVGGAFGSWLLLATPERTFAGLAPYLVLFATLLFLFQALRSHSPTTTLPPASLDRRRWLAASAGQLLIAIYGGYFGAGIGILMLATLAFMGLTDIHAMNGLKNFFGICINVVAALYFIARGAVEWPLALVMLLGAVLGGYAGARFARSIGREKARVAVVVIGFAITLLLFWRAR